MDIKANDATPNRPHGERLLDAPVVRMDFPGAIARLKTELAWEKGDKNAVTLLHTDRLRHVLIVLKTGAGIPEFTVDGPMTVLVLLGKVDATAGDQVHDLGVGEALSLHDGNGLRLKCTDEAAVLLTLVGSHEGATF